MRNTFEQFNHPVVRSGLEPITGLKGIYAFAAMPGAFNGAARCVAYATWRRSFLATLAEPRPVRRDARSNWSSVKNADFTRT